MSSSSSSSELFDVFKDLPAEAQQEFLKRNLPALLSALPQEELTTAKSSALRLKQIYEAAPRLDLDGARKQIDTLFDSLAKESKLSVFPERSIREQVLEEIIRTLTSWLNDIWTTVYENHGDFKRAHACLLFVAESMEHLDEGSGSRCRCDFINIPVHIQIKNKNGRVVKRLRALGAQNIDRVLFWIWRDLFLAMLEAGSESEKKEIPKMLENVESVYGFQGIQRLLRGGYKSEEGEEEDMDILEAPDIYDEDDGYESDVPFEDGYFHSNHWDGMYAEECGQLRELAVEFLLQLFSNCPSLSLYLTIIDLANDVNAVKLRITAILTEIAGASSETLVTSLTIASITDDQNKIISLLNKYSYLIRDRDAIALQAAVSVLANSPSHFQRAKLILAAELEDTLQSIRRAVFSSFRRIDGATHRKSLSEILKMPNGPARKERIETWTDSVLTSQGNSFGSMALAAMMIGLPLPMHDMDTDEDNNGDMFNFFDIDGPPDPDLDDVRDELRPNLAARFEGWNTLGSIMKVGPALLTRAYKKALELMPFLAANDVVSEMVRRLRDRPNKAHVSDALQTLSTFCKSQRAKARRKAQKEQKEAVAAQAIRDAIHVANILSTTEGAESSNAGPTSPSELGGPSSNSAAGATPSTANGPSGGTANPNSAAASTSTATSSSAHATGINPATGFVFSNSNATQSTTTHLGPNPFAALDEVD
ncbi:hypothetical protein FA15DRAFT_641393 [Coprinopsis marcescibilis]|uniref:ARM repeat-containing protein n=1 Tax=Coprinopsis marcescibilis TaxID=230819 RepID=A0A5C3KUW3_COPMA|nr:hypothetical protein FA15DRAFT_641393 [Coprinopsis marcescibilis]